MTGDFYKSNAWTDLIALIKLQRVNADGQIICEYCGKPIVKKYDCIGHHKTELTEDNVNNPEIALNPENIALVHHRCHNRIHNKLGYSGREVYIVWGAPCSGKTSFVRESMCEGDLIVDMDNIWECVSGCKRYVKPNCLNQNVFAVRDLLIDMIRTRRGRWRCAWIIGGYPYSAVRERLRKNLDAKEIFIDVSKEECLKRLAESDRDFEEWSRYISEWFDRYSPHAGSEPP